jgi:hypothetical protein
MVTFVEEESVTICGTGRNDRFAYAQRFGELGEVAKSILLEPVLTSGRQPTSTIKLRSYLGNFVEACGVFTDSGSFLRTDSFLPCRDHAHR